LGPDEKLAKTRFHELMVEQANAPKITPLHKQPEQTPLVTVFDAFLDWCSLHRSPGTFEFNRFRIQSFLDFKPAKKHFLPAELSVETLKPFHVQEWIDSHSTWNSGMRHGAIAVVQRALNWALKQGRIEKNPIVYLEKPPYGRRDTIVTPKEFEEILQRTKSAAFRDLLVFSWVTGARPQESIRIEARHFEPANERITLPPEEAKGKKHHRLIYLQPKALELVRRLAAERPTGPLFLNCEGNPWTPFAVNCAFSRLQVSFGMSAMKEQGINPPSPEIEALAAKLRIQKPKKSDKEILQEARSKVTYRLARKYGRKCCLYLLRHSFCTRALENGLDSITVSILMGHRDTTMVHRTYQHLGKNPTFLQEQAKRIPN